MHCGQWQKGVVQIMFYLGIYKATRHKVAIIYNIGYALLEEHWRSICTTWIDARRYLIHSTTCWSFQWSWNKKKQQKNKKERGVSGGGVGGCCCVSRCPCTCVITRACWCIYQDYMKVPKKCSSLLFIAYNEIKEKNVLVSVTSFICLNFST